MEIELTHNQRLNDMSVNANSPTDQAVAHETETQKVQQLIGTDKPNPRDIVSVYNQATDIHKEEIIPVLTHLNNAQLESIAVDVLMIVRSELSSVGTHLNIHYVAMLLERLSEVIQGADKVLQNDFKQLLSDLKQDHANNALIQLAVQKSEQIQSGLNQNSPFLNNPTQVLPKSINITPSPDPTDSIAQKYGFTEKIFGDKQAFTQEGLSVVTQPGHPSQIIATLPNQAAHVHAFGDKHRMVAGIVQVGNVPPVLVVSGIIEYLIVQQGRLKDKQNIYKLAIVTDSVASIHLNERPDNIRLLDINTDISSDIYFNEYEQLIEEGYQYIISLHVNAKLSRSFHYAQRAAERIKELYPDQTCHVVNTYANGLGLGLIVSEIHQAIIDHYSPKEIFHLIKECLENLSYWVVPESFNYSVNQKWVAPLLDRKDRLKLKMFNFKPLITLKEKVSVLGLYHENEQATRAMLSQLNKQVQSSKRKIHRIGIEHRQQYREVNLLQNKLKAHYKQVKISSHIAGSITATRFGPKLMGICVI